MGLSPEFLYVSLGVERFSSELPGMGWYKCACVCVCVCVCVCMCVYVCVWSACT